MSNVARGLLAGLAATVVLSALMVMKSMMGLMPELAVAPMLAKMGGSPDSVVVGWIIHFIIGVVGYGLAIAWIRAKLPGQSWVARGIALGIVGWLFMMVVLMPMGGAGFFAMNLGILAMVVTLVLHLIFGAVLGWTYSRLASAPSTATA